MSLKLATAALMAAGILCGCGGGGSSTPTAVNAQKANENFTKLNATYTNITGKGTDGTVYRFDLKYEPKGTAAFPWGAVVGNSRETTIATYLNGTLSGSAVSTDYFSTTNFIAMGSVVDGTCATTTDGQTPPADSHVGDHEGLFNFTQYNSCDRATAIALGTGRYTWSVEEADGSIFYCVNTSSTAAGITAAGGECHETDVAGTLGARVRISVNVTGGPLPYSLTAKNY